MRSQPLNNEEFFNFVCGRNDGRGVADPRRASHVSEQMTSNINTRQRMQKYISITF